MITCLQCGRAAPSPIIEANRSRRTTGDSDQILEPVDGQLPITMAEFNALTSATEEFILSGLSDSQAAILLPPCALIILIQRLEVSIFEREQARARDSDPDVSAGRPGDSRLLITAAERDALSSVAGNLVQTSLSDSQRTFLWPMIDLLRRLDGQR
jgi:hypothetical protein